MLGEIHAHGLRRDLIVTNGLEDAAIDELMSRTIRKMQIPASKIGTTALRRKMTLPEAFVMLKSANVG